MKKIILSLSTILICSILFTACGQKAIKDDCGCFMDYDQAIEYSNKKNKALLVFFTSEGDDSNNTQMVNSVIKAPAFKGEIASKYAVLHVDFSQDIFQKSLAPENASQDQQELANVYTNILQNNYQLAVLFNISQMPGIFLCTPQGYVVCRLDADKEILDYETFKNQLLEKEADLNKFKALVAATKKGSNVKKVEAVDNLYNATDSDYRAFMLPILNYAIELDPQNESGLTGKFVLAKAEIEALFAYSQGDVESAVSKYLIAADNQYVKAEEKQEILFKVAYLVAYSESDDYEGILSYLQTAYDIAPESNRAPAIKEAIDYFEAIINTSEDN